MATRTNRPRSTLSITLTPTRTLAAVMAVAVPVPPATVTRRSRISSSGGNPLTDSGRACTRMPRMAPPFMAASAFSARPGMSKANGASRISKVVMTPA